MESKRSIVKQVDIPSSFVLDKGNATAIELPELVHVVNKAITGTGELYVRESLKNPSTDREHIISKQEALAELRSNDALRQQIEDVLCDFQKVENQVDNFFHPGLESNAYEGQRIARETILQLPKWASHIQEPESRYLQNLKSRLDLGKFPVYQLARGPVFRTIRGKQVRGLGELGENFELVSPFPFHSFPSQLSTTTISTALPTVVAYFAGPRYPGDVVFSAVLVGGFAFIGYQLGKMRDSRDFITPMKERFQYDPEAYAAWNAIGKLDELLVYDKFGKSLPHACIPEMTEGKQHRFYAKNLVNPVQCRTIENYIPNEIDLHTGQQLTFLTGPNSGGKTSTGTSVSYAQILGQVGCYAPADEMKAVITDRIFYQVGRKDSVKDQEGGFGTQLEQSRKILEESTSNSLVIIDDLIEGTRHEEKTEHTRNQLYGFLHKGCSVLYISHHDELAQEFENKDIGNFYQVEFDGEKPTHRIIPGISTNSHADVVAKRKGMDEGGITSLLVEQGHLSPGSSLNDISRFSRK